MLRSYFLVFLLCGVLLCPAFAQDAGTDDEYLDYGEGGGLVVTAGRTPEAADSVPAQITVITAGDIAASGAQSVTEVLEKVPGVRFSGAMAGTGSEAVSMRGFGESSFGRVLVLVDGNKINDPDMKAANWNAVPLSDIERIEVLDGSASVQYGNYAVGGVINIITKKSGERRTRIGLSGGSFLSHRESISHFEPTSWGNLSLSAENTGTDGYRERQYSRTSNIALGANVFLRDNLNLSLNASFAALYFQLPGALSKDQFEDDPTQALSAYTGLPNFDDENTERHFGGGIGLQWFPLENLEVNLPLSYKGKFINAEMASWVSFTDRTLHTAEARPQGSFEFNIAGMPLRLLGGADFYFVKLDGDVFNTEAHTNTPRSFVFSEWAIGPYLTARFSPLSNLTFSAGARFDMAKIGGKNHNSNVDINDSKTLTAFVYEGGLAFNPLSELKLYAKYATLFRYPFVDELAQIQAMSEKFNTDLEPEKGFNAEVGAAYSFGKILEINANFFFMDLEDEIGVAKLDPFNPYDTTNVNLDKTRRLGVNAGLTFMPLEYLSLDASWSFVNAVFAAGANKDKKVPLVPAHTLRAGLTVKLPFGLEFGPDIEYTSASFYSGDYANTQDELESRFLLGANARYVFEKGDREFSLLINAKNILNKQYAVFGSYDSDMSLYTLYPADGRSINVSLGYRF